MPDGLAVSSSVGAWSAVLVALLSTWRQTPVDYSAGYPAGPDRAAGGRSFPRGAELHRLEDSIERLEGISLDPADCNCTAGASQTELPWWLSLVGFLGPLLSQAIFWIQHCCCSRFGHREQPRQEEPPAAPSRPARRTFSLKDASEDQLIRRGSRAEVLEATPKTRRVR